jgi:hypothetical protein
LTRPGLAVAALALALAAAACERSETDSIVRAAAMADDAWGCPVDSTRVFEIGHGRFRLSGCHHVVVYECTARPPTCQRTAHE